MAGLLVPPYGVMESTCGSDSKFLLCFSLQGKLQFFLFFLISFTIKKSKVLKDSSWLAYLKSLNTSTCILVLWSKLPVLWPSTNPLHLIFMLLCCNLTQYTFCFIQLKSFKLSLKSCTIKIWTVACRESIKSADFTAVYGHTNLMVVRKRLIHFK